MIFRASLIIAVSGLSLAISTPAAASPETTSSLSDSTPEMDMMYGGDESGSGGAFVQQTHQAMQKMQKNMMAVSRNGNPDHDFASMMIPHHQGAIDMAELELKFGKDPVLRKLATRIISDQKREIAEMKARLGHLDASTTASR